MSEFLSQDPMPAIISLTVVGLMFVLFIRETYPTEVVAIGGVAILLISGVLPIADLQAVFSNPAPWTIAAMFIISGGLVRTGALNVLTSMVARYVGNQPKLVLAALAVFTVVTSAFMNNTPVVVLMIPVAVSLAGTMEISTSKLLIPLSYTAILGGMLTLIGTSTNLLVDGVATAQGLEPFGLFEVQHCRQFPAVEPDAVTIPAAVDLDVFDTRCRGCLSVTLGTNHWKHVRNWVALVCLSIATVSLESNNRATDWNWTLPIKMCKKEYARVFASASSDLSLLNVDSVRTSRHKLLSCLGNSSAGRYPKRGRVSIRCSCQ